MAASVASTEVDVGLTLAQAKQQRLKALDDIYVGRGFEAHHKEISQYIEPRRGRYLSTDANQGSKRNQSVVDPVARRSSRIQTAGMMAGMTSPARPWFTLGLEDKELEEYRPVKEWLSVVTQRMLAVLKKSNYYNVQPLQYKEQGLFGQMPKICVEDSQHVVRFIPCTVGTYRIAQNAHMVVDTLYRRVVLTTKQCVERFGRDRISDRMKLAATAGNWFVEFEVVNIIEPRKMYDPMRLDTLNMPWASYWFDFHGEAPQLMAESGFRERPFTCSRWEVNGEDTYGLAPGMDALGDVKELVHNHRKKQQIIDKLATPPMKGPAMLENKTKDLRAGGFTAVAENQGTGKFEPAHLVDARALTEIRGEIQDKRQRIEEAFFVDLFQAISRMDRREVTAREIAERSEEKLLALGPVLESNEYEDLSPTIDRVYAIMERKGLIPPPPEELDQMPLKVEYISTLSQAQKMIGIGGIERLASYVGAVAAVKPEVVDKFDADQSVDEMGEMLGVPPGVIRTDDEVAADRQARAEQQQQAAQLDQMTQAAKAAKDASGIALGNGQTAGDLVSQSLPV